LGSNKCYHHLKMQYYWPRMKESINEQLQNCDLCLKHKPCKINYKIPGQNLNTKMLFEKIAIDITGPLERTTDGYVYILGIIDHFSKIFRLVPMKNATSESVVEALMINWISIFGIPNSIHSDRGSAFESVLFKQLCSSLSIKKTRSTPYYPQGDGVVERLFGTVKPIIKICCEEQGYNWTKVLPGIQLSLNNSKIEKLGFSANEIVFGTQWNDIQTSQETNNNYPFIRYNSVDERVAHVKQTLKRISSIIKMKQGNERSHETQPIRQPNIKLNDIVYVKTLVTRTGRNAYDGPYKVIKNLGLNAVRVINLKTWKEIEVNLSHVKRAGKCEGRL
jgi:transposase InsO family protein